MGRIGLSKKAELVRSAKIPFAHKLALSAAASRGTEPLILNESFAEPVLEVIKLFNLADGSVGEIAPLIDAVVKDVNDFLVQNDVGTWKVPRPIFRMFDFRWR